MDISVNKDWAASVSDDEFYKALEHHKDDVDLKELRKKYPGKKVQDKVEK